MEKDKIDLIAGLLFNKGRRKSEQPNNPKIPFSIKGPMAMEAGYKYDSETGIVTSPFGNSLRKPTRNNRIIASFVNKEGIDIQFRADLFAWYYHYGELLEDIEHIDGDNSNDKIDNLEKKN